MAGTDFAFRVEDNYDSFETSAPQSRTGFNWDHLNMEWGAAS